MIRQKLDVGTIIDVNDANYLVIGIVSDYVDFAVQDDIADLSVLFAALKRLEIPVHMSSKNLRNYFYMYYVSETVEEFIKRLFSPYILITPLKDYPENINPFMYQEINMGDENLKVVGERDKKEVELNLIKYQMLGGIQIASFDDIYKKYFKAPFAKEKITKKSKDFIECYFKKKMNFSIGKYDFAREKYFGLNSTSALAKVIDGKEYFAYVSFGHECVSIFARCDINADLAEKIYTFCIRDNSYCVYSIRDLDKVKKLKSL